MELCIDMYFPPANLAKGREYARDFADVRDAVGRLLLWNVERPFRIQRGLGIPGFTLSPVAPELSCA